MTLLLAGGPIVAMLLQSSLPSGQPSPDVVLLSRSVLAAIVATEFSKVEEQFTDAMKTALPPDRLAATWATLLNQVGPYKSCGSDPRVRRIGDKQMVITPCQFGREPIDIQFAVDGNGRISGLVFRPGAMPVVAYTLPPYAKPSSFVEGETTIGSGEWALPVTVTVPVGTGPWPAVVLVHGSDPNDRDETVGASKPFKDLATGLASRGIAVPRYDKRTMVHGPRIAALKEFTVREEVIEDVLEALKALRARPAIDPARVFVLGHSLGGMLIPRIATADPTIAGLIVLAGPARPLEEALVDQTRYIALADGTISAEEPRAIDQAAAVGESIRGPHARRHKKRPHDRRRAGLLLAGSPWLRSAVRGETREIADAGPARGSRLSSDGGGIRSLEGRARIAARRDVP